MANNDNQTNRVFHALSDPTRRAIVMRLSEQERAVGDLFKPMPMALPTLLKHINVLEECGLIVSRKIGRERVCELRPTAMGVTDALVAAVAFGVTAARIAALSELVKRTADADRALVEEALDRAAIDPDVQVRRGIDAVRAALG